MLYNNLGLMRGDLQQNARFVKDFITEEIRYARFPTKMQKGCWIAWLRLSVKMIRRFKKNPKALK